MINQEFMQKLIVKNSSKIVFLIFDGLGGIQDPSSGKTELETANHPNLDSLAKRGICGLSNPIAPGITPGSGPAHLALFGYDPLKYEIGRGLLDSLGIDFEFTQDDLAARGNFATVDETGTILDRRAGRIPTEKNIEICKNILNNITIEGIQTFVLPVKEHRFSVIFRGKNLNDKLTDSDPQKEGLKPLPVKAIEPNSEYSATIVNRFIEETNKRLKNQHPANSILLRGFAKMINIPSFQTVYGLNPCAIALYPMYRGISRLLGMDVLNTGTDIESEFLTLKENFQKYDFFFIHIKQTDSSGEDGNFNKKVKVIEEVDNFIPILNDLNPDVIVITGDHSTPAAYKAHSWHPVPIMIVSNSVRKDNVEHFTEIDCLKGGLGIISSQDIMPLALAHAGKLMKFGA